MGVPSLYRTKVRWPTRGDAIRSARNDHHTEGTAMRAIVILGVLVAGATLSGCATSQEWAEWKQHSSHFASGEHLTFSVRNREGKPTRVSRADVERARAQTWWGKTITVDQAAIVEN
jgi:hypothetical protein